MPNTTLTASIIAKEALMILENKLAMKDLVYRGYEDEFDKNINGYKVGDTVTIRRPTQFTVRTTEVMSQQDTVEGSTSISVNKVAGVDFGFTMTDLTLKIGDLSERVIKPAMVQITDKIDQDLNALFKDVNNWVGTPGNLLTNYASFAAGSARLSNLAVPLDGRSAILSVDDKYSMLGNATGPNSIFDSSTVGKAFHQGELGTVDGVTCFETQNAGVLTCGTRTVGTNSGGVATTWAASKDVGTQTLAVAGLGAAGTVKEGEVFTLAGVFDVNPINKTTQTFLKQFVVTADATADGAGAATLTIRPAMILTGAFQNISAQPAANAVLTWKGTASTSYRQNMIFQKNAFALCIVPMERPEGAVKVSRMSHNGVSVRVIPVYDGANNTSAWRLDVLYGLRTIDERRAVRVNGA